MDIKAAIPHREPFLLLDEILDASDGRVLARTTLRPGDELWSRIYAGHYPSFPVTPGVLLCEMAFQAGGCLVSRLFGGLSGEGVPMLARIQGAKFKTPVLPGDVVEIEARLSERMGNAFFMKGSVRKEGKIAAQVEFSIALVEPLEKDSP